MNGIFLTIQPTNTMNKTLLNPTELAQLVTLIRPLQIHRSTVPALHHVWFEPAADGQATAFATNFDATVIVPGTASQSSLGGHLSVSFALLQRLAKEADRDHSVSFTVAEGKVRAEWTTQGVPMEHEEDLLPRADFPDVDTRGFTKAMKVPRALLDLLQASQASISTDQTRYVLNGVFLDGDSQRVVSTDGQRMFCAVPPVKIPCRAIVPTAVVGHLLTAEADALWFREKGEGRREKEREGKPMVEPREKAITHGLARLRGGALLLFRCIKGNYPHWKQVVPAQAHYCIPVAEPEALLGKVKAVKLGAREECQTDLNLNPDGTVQMRLRRPDCKPGGWMDVGRTEQPVARGLEAIYNARFLQEALASVGEPVIYLTDSLSPVMLQSRDQKRMVVLMPMRA